MLVHSQTGERFEIDISGPVRSAVQKQQAIMQAAWKPLGVEGRIDALPPAMDVETPNRSNRPAMYMGSIGDTQFLYNEQLCTCRISMPPGYTDRNRGGYSNPAMDIVYDRLRVSPDDRDRAPLYREIVRLAMGDLAVWPFYWDVYAALALSSVRGEITPANNGVLMNIMEWDKV